ncbi:hypothetical protein UlMin_001339 [Ulmus minor]
MIGRLCRLGASRRQIVNYASSAKVQVQDRMSNKSTANSPILLEDRHNIQAPGHCPDENSGDVEKHKISKNISRKEKVDFLVKTLLDLKDSKEAVYGALDAWVAWEQNFPIATLKMALFALEKEEEWHRVVQVIKWMLSKGQGTTLGTYNQLIRALDMDNRPDEAHEFWERKIGIDLHSVPWQLCRSMIAIYYRNNMFDRIVKLFEGLEAYDRKVPDKSIALRVANAYELLGRLDENERVLEKYSHLFIDNGSKKKSERASPKKKK